MEMLQLELGSRIQVVIKFEVLISLILKINQLMSLKFKSYLHITALYMITFHYLESLIYHFLIKI